MQWNHDNRSGALTKMVRGDRVKRFNPISEVEQNDLTQSNDRKEVAANPACINRNDLEINATPIGQPENWRGVLSPQA
jgi:hypothetical protein